MLLGAGVVLILVTAISRRSDDDPEDKELPPTIDGRSQATGLVRYKMEDHRDSERPT
jgi:hypothetical protein